MAVVKLKNVRLAFPDLFEAKSIDGGKARFGAVFLIEPGSPEHKAIVKAMVEVAEAQWPKKGKDMVEKLMAGDKTALRNGDDKEDYDGFAGMRYLSAYNHTRPTVLDRDRSPLTAQDGKPYAGCYVNASVDVWAQDNKWGKRVNAQLRGVQFASDGDAFAGGVASDDEFEDLGVDEDLDIVDEDDMDDLVA